MYWHHAIQKVKPIIYLHLTIQKLKLITYLHHVVQKLKRMVYLHLTIPKTETNGLLNNKLNVSNPEITSVLKGNEFDSKNNLSHIQFKNNNAIHLEYDFDYDTKGRLVFGKPLALSTSLDIPWNSKLLFQHTDSCINETLNSGNFLNFVMKEQTGQIDVGDPANASNLVMTLQMTSSPFIRQHHPLSQIILWMNTPEQWWQINFFAFRLPACWYINLLKSLIKT